VSIVARGYGQGGAGAIVAAGYTRNLNNLADAFAFAVQVCVESMVLSDQVRSLLAQASVKSKATMTSDEL
jgi:hypothetical protein